MEHVGLYVGLAVYTLAGAKVHVQKFLHPQLGSPSHKNHHIHYHSLLSDISSYRKSCWTGEVGGVSGELPVFIISKLLLKLYYVATNMMICLALTHSLSRSLMILALYFFVGNIGMIIFRATTKSSSPKTEIVGKTHISQFNIPCHDLHNIIDHQCNANTNNVSGAVDIKEDPVFKLSAQWKHQQCQLQRAGKKTNK